MTNSPEPSSDAVTGACASKSVSISPVGSAAAAAKAKNDIIAAANDSATLQYFRIILVFIPFKFYKSSNSNAHRSATKHGES